MSALGMKPPRFLKAGETITLRALTGSGSKRSKWSRGRRVEFFLNEAPVVVDGGGFAAVHGLGVRCALVDYVRRSDAWFADLPLSLAALPFTPVMRRLNCG